MNPSITIADALFIIVVFCAVCSLLYALGLTASFIWIGRGESDVNGDPERDAGIEPAPPHKTHRVDIKTASELIPSKKEAPRPWPQPPTNTVITTADLPQTFAHHD